VTDRERPSEDAVRESLRHEREELAGDTEPRGNDASATGGDAGHVAHAEDARSAEARMAQSTGVKVGTAKADAEAEAEVAAEPEGEEDLAAERDRYLDLARRTQADFDNYRKRAAKDAAAAGARAKSGLVRELLPVVDNLERALAAASDSDATIAQGVRLVHADLVGVLERNGIQSSVPEGERFDPTEHEAVSMRSEDGAEPGIVLDVVEKGYKLNDTVIRPARVVVSG
jgi:molecular chaperone GrpE